VISKPDWSSGIADVVRSGGPAIDLHIHDTHYIGLVCGVPKAVHSRGIVEQGAVVYLDTQYLYDDAGLTVSATSGAVAAAGRPFAHGFEIYLEGATLSFSFANVGGKGQVAPLSVILPDGTAQYPDLGASDPVDGFVAELELAVESVKSGAAGAQLSGELARQALMICHAEVRSVKEQRVVAIG
jgi:predicted dehydrogenase